MRPLPLVVHPYTERTRPIAPPRFSGERAAQPARLPIAARLQSERRGHERVCRRPRRSGNAAACCP